jgi:hypothetical protein
MLRRTLPAVSMHSFFVFGAWACPDGPQDPERPPQSRDSFGHHRGDLEPHSVSKALVAGWALCPSGGTLKEEM